MLYWIFLLQCLLERCESSEQQSINKPAEVDEDVGVLVGPGHEEEQGACAEVAEDDARSAASRGPEGDGLGRNHSQAPMTMPEAPRPT